MKSLIAAAIAGALTLTFAAGSASAAAPPVESETSSQVVLLRWAKVGPPTEHLSGTYIGAMYGPSPRYAPADEVIRIQDVTIKNGYPADPHVSVEIVEGDLALIPGGWVADHSPTGTFVFDGVEYSLESLTGTFHGVGDELVLDMIITAGPDCPDRSKCNGRMVFSAPLPDLS